MSKKRELKSREPFIHMSKRDHMPLWKSFGVRLIGLALALVICAIIIYSLTKLNPLKVYGAMFKGAFGTEKRIWVTIRDIMMLLCIAAGIIGSFNQPYF